MSDPTRIVETETPRPSLDHQAVDKMAELMKHELDANRELKGGRSAWSLDQARMHVLQTYYHTGKLQIAVTNLERLLARHDRSRAEVTYLRDQVKEFAADVANHSMMVLDILGLLDLPPSVPEPPPLPPKAEPPKQEKSKKDKEYGGWT